MQRKLIDKVELDNGLTLEIYDYSKRVAGDRWLVSLAARIDVDLEAKYFEGKSTEDPAFDEVRSALGDRVTYRYQRDRNFIAESEKDNTLQDLKKQFTNVNFGYLSNPNFPRRLIMMHYRQTNGQLTGWQHPTTAVKL